MAGQGLRPDLVVVSTSRRTQETWARAAPAFAGSIPSVDDARVYEATPETLLAIVRQTGSEVRALMLVGHNPGLTDLANMLLPSLDLDNLPTAGVVAVRSSAVRWKDIDSATLALGFYDSPKQGSPDRSRRP